MLAKLIGAWLLAHCGVAATVIGIAVSTAYGVQDDVQMAPGKKLIWQDITIEFISQEPLEWSKL